MRLIAFRPTPSHQAPSRTAPSHQAPSRTAPSHQALSRTTPSIAASTRVTPILTAAFHATPFATAPYAPAQRRPTWKAGIDGYDGDGLQPSASAYKAVKREDGSVLPLLPVLIIICFLLGTLSVSTASTFLAKRELYNAAAAAANDAVSGIDDVDYYTNSAYTFDPTNMKKLATQSITARLDDTLRMRSEDIVITLEDGGVRVTLEADFSPVFRGFLPGGLKKTRLKATALAEARTTP
jgi:hypothetical protein